MKTKARFCIVLFFVAVTAMLVAGAVPELQGAPSSYSQFLGPALSSFQVDQISRDISMIEQLYRYIDTNYLYDVDYTKVYNSMLEAMLEALGDDYSYYVEPELSTTYSEVTTGDYGGIGIYLQKANPEYRDMSDPKTYLVIITSPFPGSPAERAGIIAGDMISHIDGEPVDTLTATEASSALKGPAGTSVTITIVRGSSSFDVTLTRELVSTITVESTILEGNVGYLQISEFSVSTDVQVLAVLEQFAKEAVSGIVIDLRNNNGGSVETALSIADMLMSNQQMLIVKEKKKANDTIYKASSNTVIPTTTPIVVLINGGSASSSEILAAALKDSKRGTLIGTTTYGKGVMQSISSFGEGYISLTTAEFLSPSGSTIHKNGVNPDIEVEDLIILEEEIPGYETLLKEQVFQNFADAHPEFTNANIQLFMKEYSDSGIRPEVLAALIRNEYAYRLPYAERLIADPVYDPVLNRAMEFLKTQK